MLTFEIKKHKVCNVRDTYSNKIIGSIYHSNDGYQYVPKGSSSGGEFFGTFESCKLSLYTPEELSDMQ